MRKGVKFTLRVSAGLQGLEPFAYVTDVPSRMATHPYKQLEELLPQNGKPAAKSKKIYLLKSIKRKNTSILILNIDFYPSTRGWSDAYRSPIDRPGRSSPTAFTVS